MTSNELAGEHVTGDETPREQRDWIGKGHHVRGPYELIPSADGYTVRIHARGNAVLASPTINRGTAFTLAQRRELGLAGLLPTGVTTLEGQLAPGLRPVPGAGQRSAEVGVPGEPAGPQRGAVLPAADRAHLRDAAGRLHPDRRAGDRTVQPGIPPHPRGLPVGRSPGGRRDRPAEHRSRARTTSTCWWPPTPRASSGIGDQGVGGIEISIGKLAVYTAAAGIHPRRVLPVVLDMGTDNLTLLNDDMYLGARHARVRDQRYDDLIDAYVTAVSKLFPNAMLHWEDFGATNARRILNKYADQVCTFNDDMQGTAADGAGRGVLRGRAPPAPGCATSGSSSTAPAPPGWASRT